MADKYLAFPVYELGIPSRILGNGCNCRIAGTPLVEPLDHSHKSAQ